MVPVVLVGLLGCATVACDREPLDPRTTAGTAALAPIGSEPTAPVPPPRMPADSPRPTGAADGGMDGGGVTPEGGPSTDAGAPDAAGDDAYARMCRNYCQALADTDFYYCLQAGFHEATYCDRALSTDLCFNERCTPMRVQPPLCFTQCDNAYAQYAPYCARTGACPWDPEARHAQCKDACVLPDAGSP
jgi:hypothetical protein